MRVFLGVFLPSFPFSSCDTACVRFPQPRRQNIFFEDLRVFYTSTQMIIPPAPQTPELLLHIFSLCQSLSTLRSQGCVKTGLDHRAEPKQTGQEFLHSDTKMSDEKVTYASQWRRKWPPLLINQMVVLTKLSKKQNKKLFQKECYLMESLHASEPFMKASHIASHF